MFPCLFIPFQDKENDKEDDKKDEWAAESGPTAQESLWLGLLVQPWPPVLPLLLVCVLMGDLAVEAAPSCYICTAGEVHRDHYLNTTNWPGYTKSVCQLIGRGQRLLPW